MKLGLMQSRLQARIAVLTAAEADFKAWISIQFPVSFPMSGKVQLWRQICHKWTPEIFCCVFCWGLQRVVYLFQKSSKQVKGWLVSESTSHGSYRTSPLNE